LHRFEGRARFFTRLTRIVINAALLKRRASKTLPAISLEDTVHEHEIPAAERLADDRAGPERVYSKIRRHRIVNELSPLLPTASLLREVEGYSTAEPATKLGVKESTLKARLWRSRQKLGKRVNRRRAHYAKAEA
jgi:RNA polymerase sigma-70 factor (ECF subfamily)